MQRSKLVFGLVAVAAIMMFAASSFAQTNLTAFGNASAAEIASGRTVAAYDPTSSGAGLLISGANLAQAPLTTTMLKIAYGVPITSSPAAVSFGAPAWTGLNVGGPIAISGGTGLFAGATISTINYSSGLLTITLPSSAATTASGSFRVTGVKLDVSGSTATSIVPTLSLDNTANNYVLSTSSIAVINSLAAGVGSLTNAPVKSSTTNPGPITILTNGTNVQATTYITVKAGAAGVWRMTDQDAGLSQMQNATKIRLTFTGIPVGVTLGTFTVTGGSGTWTASASSVTSANNTLNLQPTTDQDLTSTDSVQLQIGTSTTAGVTYTSGTKPAAGSITVTATMFPIGIGLDTTVSPNAPPTSGDGLLYPRFVDSEVGPTTIANIISAQTQLLIPYAVTAGNYDTGIAIANTTSDPYGGSSAGGATAGSGNLIFTFYPTNVSAGGAAASFTYSTGTGKLGGFQGMSADGTVASGATVSGNLSQLLTAAGQTSGQFFGYIFVQTNFLNAHGVAYIYNGSFFTSATSVLVLPNPLAGGTSARSAEVGLNN